MSLYENVVPIFTEAKPANKRQIQERIAKLALISDPPLHYGMIAFIVRGDFPHAKTTAKSVASTIRDLPANLKAQLPKNRLATPPNFKL